ncbi:aquaporin AQPAe.a-like [Aricia agestis]|uniref:aquaporin AQPAe.a-like n=1 Tax=Aricia agestis TaxID=91739 RepID=UPI001C20B794|nr:aquaporin AQPAe.a-like [Aricia agestis]
MAVEAHVVVTENMIVNEAIRKKRTNKLLFWSGNYWRAILGEVVSTALLMLLGCMTCIPVEGPLQPLYAPIGFGLIVLFNVQTFGHISGAHMNPCVTLAAVIWGKMSVLLGVAYLAAQCVGAFVGYGALVALSPSDFLGRGICVTQPHMSYTPLQALGIEALLTAALIFITCSIWDPVNETHTEAVSLKFGLTVIGLSLAGGPLTGASMNPARSLGPAMWTNTWNVLWLYWMGPLLGATFAVVVYKQIWLKLKVQELRSHEMVLMNDEQIVI